VRGGVRDPESPISPRSKPLGDFTYRGWDESNTSRITVSVSHPGCLACLTYETERTARRGAPRRYADVAVQCGLVIREVFRLPLRALTGFLDLLVRLLERALSIPDYSTFSRRVAGLTV